MPEATLRVQRRGGTTHLLLDRPDRSNALDAALTSELCDAISKSYLDGTRLVVLRGAGKNFCSGFDRPAAKEDIAAAAATRAVHVESVLQLLWGAPFVTAACVQGKAIGAGADLVAACDRRIGAPGSSYSFPGFRLFGVSLGNRRLAEIVGPKRAFDLVLRGIEFGVEDAWRWNLVGEIVPANAFDESIAAIETELTGIEGSSIAELRTALAA